jgi:hypothetical protein
MKKKFLTSIFYVLFVLGSYAQHTSKTTTINGVTLPSALMEEWEDLLRMKPKEFIHVNYYYTQTDSGWNQSTDTIRNGFFYSQVPDQVAREMWDKYSEALRNSGYYLFLKNLGFDENWNSQFDVTIIKSQ